MSLTGNEMVIGLSSFIGDLWSSTTTSAGASDGTTIVDTALQRFGRDGLRDGYIRLTSGGSTLQQRRVSSFTTSTVVVAPAFSAQVASGVTYEFHRYDPSKKFTKLDQARMLVYPQVAIITLDDTVTGDGYERNFPIPTTIRKGPVQVYEEERMSPTQGWNLCTNPLMNVLTGWTAATLTAALHTRSQYDLLIPKYGEQTCTKLTGAGTYRQLVASSHVTAAQVAARRVTFGLWVFTRTASSVTATITDDSATASSSVHQGKGWEYLQVSANIVNNNATTFSVGVNISVTGTVAWVQDAMCRFGDKIGLRYVHPLVARGTLRDDTTQEVHLIRAPRTGYQLRLVGRRPLSALGTVAASQAAATMEVDVSSAELLYAKAARLLFTDAGMASGAIEKEFPKIQEVEARFAEMAPDWEYNLPFSDSVAGWWSDL